MSKEWPISKLGEVLRHRKEFITIDDLTNYKRPRVQLHVKGIVQRDEVPGALIKTKKQQVCRTGEFLVAEIDAKVGGFGIVPESLNGSLVSSHYFLFVIDETRLGRLFLDYFIRTPAFCEQVAAQGSTNYAAIRPAHVLDYEIPLPPLAEQRRLVTQIEKLAAQIHEARTLRHQAAEEADALVSARSAELFRVSSKRGTAALESIAVLERGKFSHRPRNDSRFFGGAHPWIQIGEIESAGKYIRKWTETLNDDGLAISKKFPKGTVLISIAATIGSVGILDFDCCIPDSIVGVTPRDGTDSEFIFHFLSYLRSHLEEIAPQSAQKNINLQILAPIPVPRLPLSEQRRIVAELDALQAEVDALKGLQAETAAELDAMLPSILDRAFRGQLLISALPGSGKAILTIGIQARPTFSAEDYFLQLIPALLRAVGGRLELDKLNAAVALLFLPRVLRPLIASVGGAEARAHFDQFNQPLKDSTFIPMLHVLMKTGAITCDASDQVTSIQLHESAAPPIKPVVEEDARFLAGIVNLIPPLPVQATARKLCPEPAKEELLAMA